MLITIAFILCIGLPLLLTGYIKKINYNNFPLYKSNVPKYLRDSWENKLLHSALFEYCSYFIVPIACLFIVKRPRTDRVKRLGNVQHQMQREYLHSFFRWWQTHDNAMDEYFWGAFASEGDKLYSTIAAYKAKTFKGTWLRYCNRVMWGWRNVGYTYLYEELGQPLGTDKPIVNEHGVEDSGRLWVKVTTHLNWFTYQAQIPAGDGKYQDIKFGWKTHRSAPVIKETGQKNVTYANRVIFNTKKYK